jgi:hypothetical protein
MNQEKINLTIEMPRASLSDPALRRLSGLVAAHAGLSFEETPTDTLRFDLGDVPPQGAQECAGFIAGLCEQAKQGQTAIYCRSAISNPDAIARQRETLQRFAEGQGFSNIVCYEDDGYSGLDANRPDFLRLEEDIRGGKIQRVLSEKLSHLGRNTADVVRWMLWLRRHGAEICILGMQNDLNADLETLENA